MVHPGLVVGVEHPTLCLVNFCQVPLLHPRPGLFPLPSHNTKATHHIALDALEIDVGAHQHIVQEEHLALLRLDELAPVAVNRLRQGLTKQ